MGWQIAISDCSQFSCRGPAPQGQSGHTRLTIMPGRAKKLHENQHLGAIDGRLRGCCGAWGSRRRSPSPPMRRGRSAAAQSPRLSSARANNSASFGSFPAVSRISRFSMQPIAARRAGRVSPWQDQPEIRKSGSSKRLMKPRQAGVVVGVADQPEQRHGAEFAVDDPRRFQSAHAFAGPSGPRFRRWRARTGRFAAGAVDFELRDRLFARRRPAEDVLAAAFGVPEDLVSLCFAG